MKVTRRTFLGVCAAMAMAPPKPAFPATVLRVGMTPAFLNTQYGLLAKWREYMQAKLDRPIEIVQRDSYRETMDLLRLEQVDFAWVCSYPYVYLKKQLRLVAVPLYLSQPFYRAYLIVSVKNRDIKSLSQLRGKVFAYADPYSLTGHLVPRYQLRKMGEDPERFFSRTFFTYSHGKLVEAVADGLAHGASVDSYVWDSLNALKPEITPNQTKPSPGIIISSPGCLRQGVLIRGTTVGSVRAWKGIRPQSQNLISGGLNGTEQKGLFEECGRGGRGGRVWGESGCHREGCGKSQIAGEGWSPRAGSQAYQVRLRDLPELLRH